MSSTMIEQVDEANFMASDFCPWLFGFDDGSCVRMAYGFGRTPDHALADLKDAIAREIEKTSRPCFCADCDEIPF